MGKKGINPIHLQANCMTVARDLSEMCEYKAAGLMLRAAYMVGDGECPAVIHQYALTARAETNPDARTMISDWISECEKTYDL